MEISIIEKEEALTYDELLFLEEHAAPFVLDKTESVAGFLKTLRTAIEGEKKSQAVFFMPQGTFNIFAQFQGNKELCAVSIEQVQALSEALKKMDFGRNQKIFCHLQKKIETLRTFLEQGNSVSPVAIEADSFLVMEVL